MPSSDPLWYCYECHAEMRPLMIPDPACASCRGTFVEKIEDPQDDPRAFAPAVDDIPDDGIVGEVPGIDNFFMTLQSLMDRGMSNNNRPRTRPDSPEPRFSFQVNRGQGLAAVTIGGRNTLGTPPRPREPRGNTDVPTMSNFLRRGPSEDGSERGATISNQMMAQYLLALLGDRDPLASMLGNAATGGGAPDGGRMGDYVFTQEALDQVITQIMENSNGQRPVAATEDIVENLPREVLAAGSPLLSEDCAVCKEQFSLETESSDELVVIKLPCKHPFHEPCILPWLKNSGTCPVCRYALVPQPTQPSSPPASTSTMPGNIPSSPSSRSESNGGGGLLQHLFGHLSGGSGSNFIQATPRNPSSSISPPQPRRGNSEGERRHNRDHVPGGWENDLD